MGCFQVKVFYEVLVRLFLREPFGTRAPLKEAVFGVLGINFSLINK